MAQSWRTDFCRYLAGQQGEKLIVGELVELFADEVPLHQASRLWLNRGTFKRRPDPAVDLCSPLRMRRNAICRELDHYPLVWVPDRGRRRPIADSDVVIPQLRDCIHCGKPYFAQIVTPSCGRSCSRKAFWATRREAQAQQSTLGG